MANGCAISVRTATTTTSRRIRANVALPREAERVSAECLLNEGHNQGRNHG